MRHLQFVLILVFLACGTREAVAWDNVTHAHISELAIRHVHTAELRELLLEQRDALLSGTEFPDWGHGSKPFGEITHSEFLDDYRRYLLQTRLQQRPEYRALAAHYLGVHAHTVQDRLLDATLKKRRKEVGEPRGDDMENGLFAITGLDYLDLHHELYLPAEHLIAAYQAGGWLERTGRNPLTFEAEMRARLVRNATLMRRLKLLSFLASSYVAQILPWGAANLEMAPGGLESCAKASAAMWEALWAELNGRPAPFFIFVEPEDSGTLASADAQSAYGRITVLTRRRLHVPSLTPEQASVRDADGRVMPIAVHPYIDIPGHDTDVAFQIQALEDWRPGAEYVLTLAPGSYAPTDENLPATTAFRWQAPTREGFTTSAKPARRRMSMGGMGIYLFAFLAGCAGLAFGTAYVVRLVAVRSARDPWWLKVLSVCSTALSIVLLLGAGWLLVTDGAVVIEFLRVYR